MSRDTKTRKITKGFSSLLGFVFLVFSLVLPVSAEETTPSVGDTSEQCLCNFKYSVRSDPASGDDLVCELSGDDLVIPATADGFSVSGVGSKIAQLVNDYATSAESQGIIPKEDAALLVSECSPGGKIYTNIEYILENLSSELKDFEGCNNFSDSKGSLTQRPYHDFSCTLKGPGESMDLGKITKEPNECESNKDCPDGFECHAEKKVCAVLPSPLMADPEETNYGLDIIASASKLDTYEKDPATLIGNIVGTALSFISVLFFGLMLYGGVTWMISRGNDEEAKKALNTIFGAIIGMFIVMAAYAVVSFLFGSMG